MKSGEVVEADLPEAILGAGAELASQLAEISGTPGLITISQVVNR
jgi:hypothetical protein